jgi:protein-tyrosine phosphatase
MCEIAANDGITRLVATPHMLKDSKHATQSDTTDRCQELRTAIEEQGITLQLDTAAEIFLVEDMAERVKSGELPTLDKHGRYVLLEPPSTDDCSNAMIETVFRLKLRDLTAIIAHPERIETFQHNPKLAEQLVAQGALLQVNASSITDKSNPIFALSIDLIRRGLVYVVASDAHNVQWRPPVLSIARKVCEDLIGKERAAALFQANPERILNGMDVQPVFRAG